MKPSLPALLAMVLLLAIVLAPASIIAQTNEPHENHPTEFSEDQDDDPVARVARVNFVEGDVSFLRAGLKDWDDVTRNLPLLTGDNIYAGRRARVEIQLGHGNYIRLSENTALTISDLSHDTAQFEVTEGIAIIRLERFGLAFKRFEVNTPNAALLLEQDGLYRVNVRGENESEVIARRGSMEVTTADGSFRVREGHRLLVDSSTAGRLEVALDNSRDDWDQWSYDRDTYIDRNVVAVSPDYVNNHETTYHCFYGASELAGYGTWTSYSSYGQCWIPRVSVDWDPYRNGRWVWIPRIGLTWQSNDPWGWAPYHYGRWDYIPGLGWGWFPGIRSRHNYGHRYYQWRPALVSVFNTRTSRGGLFGWFPLRPGQPWRRFDNQRHDNNRRDNDHAHLRYPGVREGGRRPENRRPGIGRPGSRDGVSVLPLEGSNRPDGSRARPEAPGREVRDWLNKGVRPGLPEMPVDAKTLPNWHRGGEVARTRPVVTPPAEVINRPVVVRNRPTDSQVGISLPRERRMISPRRPVDAINSPLLRDRAKNRGDEDRAVGLPVENRKGRRDLDEESSSPPQKVRPTRPVPSDGSSVEDSAGRERETGDKRSGGERPSERSKQRDDGDESTAGKPRTRPGISPRPEGENVNAEKPREEGGRKNETRPPAYERPRPPSEERERDDNRSRQRDEDRPRPRPEESSRSRGSDDSSSKQERPQPRVEHREEQRQEKQERRQEQREERRQENREERKQENREERQERKKP